MTSLIVFIIEVQTTLLSLLKFRTYICLDVILGLVVSSCLFPAIVDSAAEMVSITTQGPNSPKTSNQTLQWSYENDDNRSTTNWCSMFPKCCGINQSPIEVNTSSASTTSENLTVADHRELSFYGAYNPELSINRWVSMTVLNTGRTVEFRTHDSESNGNGLTFPMTVGGGACSASPQDIYSLAVFHFHWGSSDRWGSEHSFDGRKYPLEMHLVHANSKYSDINEARTFADGIVVVAVFFEQVVGGTADSDADPPPLFATLAKQLPNIRYANQKHKFLLSDLADLLPQERDRYFCYSGSLTSPPCNEVVTWTLLTQPIPLEPALLKQLRELERRTKKEDDTDADRERWLLVDNFRPAQPLNGRQVRFHAPCKH